VAKILIARRSNLSSGKPIRCSPDQELASLVIERKFHVELMMRARELLTAWREVARLDGPERFYEALEKLEQMVGKDEP
jgi:hypothetical protein